MNAQRYAEHGKAAVDAGADDRGESDERTDATTTVTNVLHHLDSIGEEDPASILASAATHYFSEKEGPSMSARQQRSALVGFTVRSRFTGDVFVVTAMGEKGGCPIVNGHDCWAMLDAVVVIGPPEEGSHDDQRRRRTDEGGSRHSPSSRPPRRPLCAG